MLQALSDLEAVAHDPGIRDFDTIYMMTVPPSMPRLLDLPFPPSSSPCCPTNTGMLAPILPRSCMLILCIQTPSDPEAITHDTDTQTFDSIFMTVPPSEPFPCLLDLSSPPPSSQSSTSPLCLSHQMRPAVPPTCTYSHSFSPEDIGLRMAGIWI
jgi:hypothetical protein